MRDRLTVIGVAAVLATVIGLAAVSRAVACSCAPLSDAEHLAHADVVFIGVAAGVQEAKPPPGDVVGMGELAFTFVVEEAIKGTPQRTMVIRTTDNGAACGAGFAVGQRWKVFARAADAAFASNSCNGSTLLAESVPIPQVNPPGDEPPGLPGGVVLVVGALAVIGLASAVAFTRGRGRAGAA